MLRRGISSTGRVVVYDHAPHERLEEEYVDIDVVSDIGNMFGISAIHTKSNAGYADMCQHIGEYARIVWVFK